jgi:NTP pyrophosphatase (non-canonical NTP hydrolase)
MSRLDNLKLLNELIDKGLEAAGVSDEANEAGYVLARTAKLATEVGEVLEAVERRLGLNFRKGVTGSWLEVVEELYDVAATALLAVDVIGSTTNDPWAELEEHIAGMVERARIEGHLP